MSLRKRKRPELAVDPDNLWCRCSKGHVWSVPRNPVKVSWKCPTCKRGSIFITQTAEEAQAQ
mgnify:CR=1 FL=1